MKILPSPVPFPPQRFNHQKWYTIQRRKNNGAADEDDQDGHFFYYHPERGGYFAA